MIYLYLFGTCFHFIYVFMIIVNILFSYEVETRDPSVIKRLQGS